MKKKMFINIIIKIEKDNQINPKRFAYYTWPLLWMPPLRRTDENIQLIVVLTPSLVGSYLAIADITNR